MFRRIGAALLALSIALGLSSCAPPRQSNELVIWSKDASKDSIEGLTAIADAFKEKHPGITVRIVRMPTRGDADATTLLTAVRGQTAPDLVLADRFTLPQFGSIGLLTDLTERVKKEGAGFTDHWLKFAVDEASYNGKLYGLPFDTDARGLFYNKKLLKEAGVDVSILDPKNGPVTVDQLFEINEKVNTTNDRGAYTKIGFIPWDQQGWPFTWGEAHHAKYFDENECRITTDDPGFVATYKDLDQWARKLDHKKVDTFLATYQPPNSPPTQSPFFNERLGMHIVYSNYVYNIAKYASHLDWGVTYPPVLKKGDKPYSWSGGSAWVIPKGSKNEDLAWEFMKYIAGEEGQRAWAKKMKYLPTYKSLLEEKDTVGEQKFFADMLLNDISSSRPPLPVGSDLWISMNSAIQGIYLKESTPEQALEAITNRVQPKLEQYCPVTMGYKDS